MAKDKTYDAILIVPSGKKHESGFMHIAVIGVTYRNGEEEFEIIGEAVHFGNLFHSAGKGMIARKSCERG